MFINPILIGVIGTILVELIGLIALGLMTNHKKK